jgi:hypothetical protein
MMTYVPFAKNTTPSMPQLIVMTKSTTLAAKFKHKMPPLLLAEEIQAIDTSRRSKLGRS